MLEVLLVRHAVAFDSDRNRWPEDALRPLTPEGMEEFRSAAEVLRGFTEPPRLMFTSPLVRTRQTAQILTEVAGWPAAEESAALTPLGVFSEVANLLNTHSNARIALIGHEPNLSQFAAAALAGANSRLTVEMKKGSVLCLEFLGKARAGGASLKWLLPMRATHR